MTSSAAPRLSAFNPARVSFGRHETFPLRYAWLPKGFSEMKGSPRCFESDEAPVRLGVGKNMVHAIRYWLRAARMARVTPDGMLATALGDRLFSEGGWDPYLEDEGTLWLKAAAERVTSNIASILGSGQDQDADVAVI